MAKLQSLAYVVAESTDIGAWTQYGEQVLGMAAQPRDGGGLGLKMDGRDARIFIEPGESDRYFASGWECADAAANVGVPKDCMAILSSAVSISSARSTPAWPNAPRPQT